MTQLFANNAASVLAAPVLVGDTTVTVAAGTGARFPSPTAGDYFTLTLYQMSGSTEVNYEIVRVTQRNGDVLTIMRSQEGTTARAYNPADPVSARATAAALAAKQDAAARDASGGFPGLTLFKLNLRNALNTVTSWIATNATAARTWTMPDRDGTVALLDDVALKANAASAVLTGRTTQDAMQTTVTALGAVSGTVTINLATAGEYTATLSSAAITFAFSNAPSAGKSQVVILRLMNPGLPVISWPANTKFGGGTLGTLTAAGVDLLGVKYDSTTATYMVFVIKQDIK